MMSIRHSLGLLLSVSVHLLHVVCFSRGKLHACRTYCPDPALPRGKSLHNFDQSIAQFPPLIHYIVAEDDYNSITDLILDETKLPVPYVAELLDFGSVYRGDPPVKPSEIESIKSSSAPETHWKQIYRMNVDQDSNFVPMGTFCRVHVNPKRFLRGIDSHGTWQNQLLFNFNMLNRTGENSISMNTKNAKSASDGDLVRLDPSNIQLVVANKPTGIPVVPTVDNLKENLIYNIRRELNTLDIQVTNRIDACTTGLLVLATSKAAAALVNHYFRHRDVGKLYRVLTHNKVPARSIGRVKHMYRRTRAKDRQRPSLLREIDEFVNLTTGRVEETKDWQIAELEILQCRKILVDERKLPTAAYQYPAHPPDTTCKTDYHNTHPAPAVEYYESTVRLVTGRTHQIRLQFSALGVPVVGDTRYAPVAGCLDISAVVVTDADADADDASAGEVPVTTGTAATATGDAGRGSHGNTPASSDSGSDNASSSSSSSSRFRMGTPGFGRDPQWIGLQCCEMTFPGNLLPACGFLDTSICTRTGTSGGNYCPSQEKQSCSSEDSPVAVIPAAVNVDDQVVTMNDITMRYDKAINRTVITLEHPFWS